jgi:hypothetical protein
MAKGCAEKLRAIAPTLLFRARYGWVWSESNSIPTRGKGMKSQSCWRPVEKGKDN